MAKKQRAKDDPRPTPAQLWRSTAPMPVDITTKEEDEAIEAIRLTEKADVLTFWRDLERTYGDEGGRPAVLDALRAQMLRVQGPPLPSDWDVPPPPAE